MKISSNLATEERLTWIRQTLDAHGQVRISDAANALSVSEMTIRRDLVELEAVGLARRVRGGAVAVGPQDFAQRYRHRAKAKARIGTKLLPLVPATGAIGIDASSTLLRLATSIDRARDLTVLTNSVETFQGLQGKPGLHATLTGGELEPRTGSLVGPLACRSASANLLLTRLFLSAAAVDATTGASETCLEEAQVKRAMAGVSAEVILAADTSKLGTRSLAVGVSWEEVNTLVTETDPDDELLDPYRNVVENIL